MRRSTLIAILLGLLAAAPPALADSDIAVRTGNHPGFGRVVFDFPTRVPFQVSRQGDAVIIRFQGGDVIGQPGQLPRNVLALDGGVGEARLVLAKGTRLRTRRFGGRVVVDVLDPDQPRAASLKPREFRSFPVTERDPPRQPPTASATAMAGSVASAAAAGLPVVRPSPAIPAAPVVAASSPEPSAPAPPPAGPVAPLQLAARPVAPPGGGHRGIAIPAGAGVGAAAFRRGGTAVIVFDARQPVDFSALRGDPLFGGARLHLLPDASEITVPLRPELAVCLARAGGDWVITVHAVPCAAPIQTRARAGAVTFLAKTPSGVVTVPDPVDGALLIVGTQGEAGQGVAVGRATPQFHLLESWQGVVVAPASDRLALRPAADGFRLAAPDGPALDLPDIPDAGVPVASAGSLTRRFPFADLPTDILYRRLEREVTAAAAAPPLGRTAERLDEARTLIGLGMGAEASGVLRLVGLDDPRAASEAEVAGLSGIAALVSGRVGEAGGIMDPRFSGTDDATFWRAVRAATLREGSPAAAAALAATAPLLLTYPKPLRAHLAPLVAETMALGAQVEAAKRLIAALPSTPGLGLARAIIAEKQGNTDAALADYDRLTASADRLIAARAVHRGVELRLARGRMNAAQAADLLDRNLYAWRGDARELAWRLRLAELDAQCGRWRDAFALLRETDALFPDHRDEINRRTNRTFSALVQGDALARMLPLDMVALAQETSGLVPPGPDGDAIAAALADHLVALDLPARAEPVLANLLARAAPGPRRAAIGLRLARLRLDGGDPAGAQAALAASDDAGLQADLAASRALVGARVMAARGDMTGAVAVLSALNTAQADAERATILERAKDWAGAVAALKALAGRTIQDSGPLDPGQQQILLRLASAAVQADDETTLAQLRAEDGSRMRDGRNAELFRLLTGGPVTGVADLKRVGQELALARDIPAALQGIGGGGPPGQ